MQRLLAFLCLFLCVNVASAGIPKELSDRLHKLFPDVKEQNVTLSPVKDIYQVVMGTDVVYASADGKYLFYGHLVDATKEPPQSLTEQVNKTLRLAAINKIDPKTLITYAPAKPLHTITVFTDIDCPYCRRLHADVPELNKLGITVRYLAFPRSAPGTPSYQKSIDAWCAKDRKAVFAAAMEGKNPPAGKNCSSAIVDSHMALVRQLGLEATPVIVTDDGFMIPGYMPPAYIAQYFKEHAKKP
jgi:thiol:disulfide interchange protein DsbC